MADQRVAGWPPGVRRIGQDDLDQLGIDADGALYWNGKRVQVRQRLVLTTWQRIVAFVTSIAIILGGIGAAAQGWAAYSLWACQIGAWSPTACPADSDDETPRNTAHQ
jgi:hypothetical protein